MASWVELSLAPAQTPLERLLTRTLLVPLNRCILSLIQDIERGLMKGLGTSQHNKRLLRARASPPAPHQLSRKLRPTKVCLKAL